MPEKLKIEMTDMEKVRADLVLLAGLLSGLVYLFLDTLFEGWAGLILGVSKKDIYFQAYQVTPAGWKFHTVSMAAFFVQFVLFIWIYAAIRPRFRGNFQGALTVALVAWIFGLLSQIPMVQAGIYPLKLAVYNLGFGLLKLPLSLIAGSYAYHALKRTQSPDHKIGS